MDNIIELEAMKASLIKEAKQLLKESEMRYERGEYLSDEEAMKRMEQWL